MSYMTSHNVLLMLFNTQAVHNCYCYSLYTLYVYIHCLSFLSCIFSFLLNLCPQWDMLIVVAFTVSCPLPQLSHTAVCKTLTCIHQATQHDTTLLHRQLTTVTTQRDAEQIEHPLGVITKIMQSNVQPLQSWAFSTVHWALNCGT